MARRIVVGVTGGIAAFKSLSLIRLLVEQGDEVQVIATESALKFIGKPSFDALSRNLTQTDLFEGVAEVRHVAIGQQADLIVVVPATANTLAKFAHGLADDLLTNTFLTTEAPVLVAPAMHTEMWQNPATQANIASLKSRGVLFAGPVSGRLTGKDTGMGRLAEPEAILEAINAVLSGQEKTGLATGKRILITAGGTREAIDPVRFLGNRSSGKQGIGLATAAAELGAKVTLLAANITEDLDTLKQLGVEIVTVSSTQDLETALAEHSSTADIIFMAAAVADFRIAEMSETKIKKDAGADLTLHLVENPDLLQGLTDRRKPGQTIIGFAAETAEGETLLQLGQEKLRRKGVDFLVLNQVSWTEGIGSDDNTVQLLHKNGDVVGSYSADKLSVARSILGNVLSTEL